MSRLDNIVNNIADRILNNTTQTLSSSNWTASTASFTSGTITRYGNIVVVALSLKATSAMNANTEYDLGTLKNVTGVTFNDKSLGTWAYGNCGIQPSGVLRLVPSKAVVANANIYPRIILITE